jgi:hypothetical protein
MEWRVSNLLSWLSRGLALTDHDSYHVEVSVFASLPDMIECFLDVIVFTDDKCDPTLRVLHA